MKDKAIDLREVVVRTSRGNKSKGYFHGWCKEPFVESDHYLTKTYGLVELTDGVVEFVDPISIKFIEPYKPKTKPLVNPFQ